VSPTTYRAAECRLGHASTIGDEECMHGVGCDGDVVLCRILGGGKLACYYKFCIRREWEENLPRFVPILQITPAPLL